LALWTITFKYAQTHRNYDDARLLHHHLAIPLILHLMLLKSFTIKWPNWEDSLVQIQANRVILLDVIIERALHEPMRSDRFLNEPLHAHNQQRYAEQRVTLSLFLVQSSIGAK
jgi:hypothetical protein